MMNGIEAMSSVGDGLRQLLIKTQRDDSQQALISVTDSGIGLDPKRAEHLFEAFFTTKTEGMGRDYRSAVLSLRPMAGACGLPECRTRRDLPVYRPNKPMLRHDQRLHVFVVVDASDLLKAGNSLRSTLKNGWSIGEARILPVSIS